MVARAFVVVLAGAVLSACASMPKFPAPPPAQKLVLEQALRGRTLGDGVFVNSLTGGETKFSVVIEGAWDGKVLTLVEDFTYSDGTQERKTWRLTKTADGVYAGSREDVIDSASVRQDGNGVRLDYFVTLSTGLGDLDVRFQDLLYLNADGSIANKAVVSKFGLRVGRVEITMRPQAR
jgi:hypothetical protein